MKGKRPSPAGLTVEPAAADDVSAIVALLCAARLPHEDFATRLAHFLVARDADASVVGAVGAQVCGLDALLRSLVVAPARRGQGLGARLVNELERTAAAWGVRRWWLLTTTAETFFKARGFRVTPRTDAPSGIAATEEFRGLCPSVATCLSRERRAA